MQKKAKITENSIYIYMNFLKIMIIIQLLLFIHSLLSNGDHWYVVHGVVGVYFGIRLMMFDKLKLKAQQMGITLSEYINKIEGRS